MNIDCVQLLSLVCVNHLSTTSDADSLSWQAKDYSLNTLASVKLEYITLELFILGQFVLQCPGQLFPILHIPLRQSLLCVYPLQHFIQSCQMSGGWTWNVFQLTLKFTDLKKNPHKLHSLKLKEHHHII